jgi:hypothetical protein
MLDRGPLHSQVAALPFHLNFFTAQNSTNTTTRSLLPTYPPLKMSGQDSTTPSFKEALKNDRAKYDDCTPCRVIGTCPSCFLFDMFFPLYLSLKWSNFIIGTGAFVGLGTYTYISGHSQLRAQAAAIRKSGSMFGMASRRAAVTATSLGMVGLGVFRWFR